MKKLLTTFVSVLLCMSFALPVAAKEELKVKTLPETGNEVISYTEYHDDGSYTEIVVISESDLTSAKSGAMTTMSGGYYKNGTKIFRQYNAYNELLYTFSLYATYYIQPGAYSVCVNSSCDPYIYDSSWSAASASSYESGNTAYGNAKFVKKLLFITIETHYVNISLTCTVNGSFY